MFVNPLNSDGFSLILVILVGCHKLRCGSGVFRSLRFGLPQLLHHDGPVSLSTYSENNLSTQSRSLSEILLRITFRSYTPWNVRSTSRYGSLLPFCKPFPRIVHVQSSRPCLFPAPPPASLKSSLKLPAPTAHGHSVRLKGSPGLPVA